MTAALTFALVLALGWALFERIDKLSLRHDYRQSVRALRDLIAALDVAPLSDEVLRDDEAFAKRFEDFQARLRMGVGRARGVIVGDAAYREACERLERER